MTVAVAWIRPILDYQQLVFVSDSRISGGATFDGTPKILSLPRNDCAIAFAGESGHGFSMMLQLSLAIDAYPKAKRGALDLSEVRSHARKLFDGMCPLIHSRVLNDDDLKLPAANFLFGGYSWRAKEFKLWQISYQKAANSFRADPAPFLCYDPFWKTFKNHFRPPPHKTAVGRVLFAGDQGPAARKLLLERLSQRANNETVPAKLDMEPFEIVRDMLRNSGLRDPPDSETIGGAPQVLKVFQYRSVSSFAVFWPDRQGRPHLHGRPCLGYEHIDKQIIDPDTLEEVYVHARDGLDRQ